MIPKEAVRSCRDLSRALRSKRRDPQEGGLHEADVHHLPARPPGRANAWGHSCEHVRGTPPKPRRPSRAAWMSSPMSSLRMTIIMMVSYISCPFPAKAEALLPCACTEAPPPLSGPARKGVQGALSLSSGSSKSGRFCGFPKFGPPKRATLAGIQKPG